jgi:hypothetical protein
MKLTKSVIWSFVLLTVIAALYRVLPGHLWNFAPQWAIAVFAGAVIPDKKLAFIIPVFSMFISDLLLQIMYNAGLSEMTGFYDGQWQNYLLFASLVFIGFAVKKINLVSVALAAFAAPTVYFILSNTITWAGSGTRGLGRPRTFSGWLMALGDGVPFYRNSLVSTFLFSAILFGGYVLITKYSHKSELAA